ncbi:MAG: signal peptidase I [Crenarchaeota archaeon]|nr:signal peptidase I [Thermoproteota archaeon]
MNILVITIIYRRVIYKKPTYNVISTYIPLMIAVTLAPLFFSGIFFGFGKSIYFVEPLAVVAPFILTLTSLSAIEHVKALMLKKWSIVFVILISVIMSFIMIQPIQLATNAGETSILFIRELMMNLTTSIIIILYGLLPALYYRLGVDLIWYYFPIQPMIKTYMSGIMLMIGLIAALVILDYTKFTHSPTLTPKKEIGIISKIKAIAPVLILGIIAISQFAGVHSFVVLTGSMEPEINPGDMVIVKKMEQYSVGDIIAFSTSGTIIVHRIYSFENSRVITKGDANNYADPWRIDQDKIIGKTMFIIPYLGYPLILLSNLFGTYYMGLLFLVSLILLFLFLSYYIKLIRRWYRYEVN